MKGFDPKFMDFPDYVLRATKEIWEDRGVSAPHRQHAPGIVVTLCDETAIWKPILFCTGDL